ncbi:MAG TPA: type I secretion protein ATPase [Roseovarius sp.]
MMLDKVTEMVAHMIGIFHTEMEDQRMRDIYDAFKALKIADPDSDPITAVAVSLKAPYELGGFTPGLDHEAPSPTASSLDPITPHHWSSAQPLSFFNRFLPMDEGPPPYGGMALGGGSFAVPSPTLEPPGSVVVITVQVAILFDNDWLVMGDGTVTFTDPAVFLNDLLVYQSIGESMTAPLGADRLMPGPDARDDAVALHAGISAFTGGAVAGSIEHVAHGAEAFGVYQNGGAVSELPALDDVMPAYLKAKAGQDESETPDEDAGHEWPDPFAGLSDADGPMPYRPDVDAGHLVVAGGNTMINQVTISSAWLDAPVIAVMGDVAKLNVIAQVNVLVQHASGGIGVVAPSTSINSAAIAWTSTAPEPDPDAEAQQEGAGGAPNLPSNWVVTRIEGDLISVNHVSQFSFQTDYDRAEVTFSGSSTFIGLGDNTIVNLTDLAELGYGYDLIIVGGAMISVNWIKQTNVLIDNDAVTYSGAFPVGVQVGDNLLFNGAQIDAIGIDSYAEMTSSFAGASDSLAGGAKTIGSDVAHDPLFEGVDLLRVLYIEGDLTTANWLEQTNVMGDSDQVHLALDDFLAATGASADVIAGSNALINLASISQYGTDSTVMVGGDVYDDALLYQAELIDTDADPLGVGMPALAPAAVAFLADDMLGPEGAQIDTPIQPTAPEAQESPDLMQTMLA